MRKILTAAVAALTLAGGVAAVAGPAQADPYRYYNGHKRNNNDAGVAIAAGVDTLLGLLCRMVLEPGVKVVTSLGAYPTFGFHVANAGAELIRVP